MDIWHLYQRANIASSLLLPHLQEWEGIRQELRQLSTYSLSLHCKAYKTILSHRQEDDYPSPLTCCLKDSDSPSPRNTSSKLRAILSSSLVVTNLAGKKQATMQLQYGLTRPR